MAPFAHALSLVTREHGTAFICAQRRVEEVEQQLREALREHFAIDDLALQNDLGGKLYLMACHRHGRVD